MEATKVRLPVHILFLHQLIKTKKLVSTSQLFSLITVIRSLDLHLPLLASLSPDPFHSTLPATRHNRTLPLLSDPIPNPHSHLPEKKVKEQRRKTYQEDETD